MDYNEFVFVYVHLQCLTKRDILPIENHIYIYLYTIIHEAQRVQTCITMVGWYTRPWVCPKSPTYV